MLGYLSLIDSINDVSKRTSPIPGNAFRIVNLRLNKFKKGKKILIFWLT
jgi:hypothetical protein